MTALIKQDSSTASMYERMTDPLEAVERMGQMFARSGMFGCESVEQGQILAMHCMSTGMSPFEIKKTYHIISGNLSMRADAMLAEFHSLGGTEKWIRYDAEAASAEWTYRENKQIVILYTIDEAKAAGYVKPGSGWAKDPGAMLRARCISRAIRMICPEVNSGLYVPEEVQEFDAPASSTVSTSKTVDAQIVSAADLLGVDEFDEHILDGKIDDPVSASEYLVSICWLNQGQTYADLTDARVNEILSRIDRFNEKVAQWKEMN